MGLQILVITVLVLNVNAIHEMYGNYTGDILLAAFFPVHSRLADSPLKPIAEVERCGPIQAEDGIQAMEAFFYTLDKINQDPQLLPGVQLGAVVLDSCDDYSHALEQGVDLIKQLMTRGDTPLVSYRDECGVNVSTEINPFTKVVGVVGGRSSDVSIQLANFFKLFHLPQVSYLSTIPDLSSRDKFPYFKRTVPSDRYQAQAMVQILKKFNWKYVSVIYENSNYGIQGFAELERAAEDAGVCFAYSKRINFEDPKWGLADYDKIIDSIPHKDMSQVAVLWADFPRAHELFLAALRRNKTDIVWIGSDGWSGRMDTVCDVTQVVRNAVTVQPLAFHLQGFDEHFTKLTPATNQHNPWFTEYWEQMFSCTFAQETKTELSNHVKQCTGNEDINTAVGGYEQQQSIHFISDAVYAFAHALSDLNEAACAGIHSDCDALKPSVITGPDLLAYLTNATFTSASKDTFHFINGMDGPSRYTIMSYREVQPSEFKWVPAGTYYGGINDAGQLNLEKSFEDMMSQYPSLSCSVPCEKHQAQTFVPGGRCCWVCTNCSEWAFVVRISDQMNSDCVACPYGMEPIPNRTWCGTMTPTFMNYSNMWAISAMAMGAVLTCIVLAVAIVLLVYCKTPVVKASGRELTFILVGVILLSYLSTFVFVAQPSLAICSLTRILLGLGFTGVYACILAKASRIARIFNDGAGSPRKARLTSPKSQLLIVSLLVLIEVLILAVWFAASPPEVKYIFPRRDVRLMVCSGSNDASYLIALIYPFLLMLFCLVYAFKTRKTPDGFNETRLIAFTSYTTVVVWLAFFMLYFINQFNIEVRTTTLCLSLSMNATSALLCLLIPKVYICLFRPEKNTREAVMMRSQSAISSSSLHNNIVEQIHATDSPGGVQHRRRRNSSVPAKPAWKTGSANTAPSSSLNKSTITTSQQKQRTNSGTQTTFSVAYYAPVYEVSEDEMKDKQTNSKKQPNATDNGVPKSFDGSKAELDTQGIHIDDVNLQKSSETNA